jgi:hypothetical protein
VPRGRVPNSVREEAILSFRTGDDTQLSSESSADTETRKFLSEISRCA